MNLLTKLKQLLNKKPTKQQVTTVLPTFHEKKYYNSSVYAVTRSKAPERTDVQSDSMNPLNLMSPFNPISPLYYGNTNSYSSHSTSSSSNTDSCSSYSDNSNSSYDSSSSSSCDSDSY